MLSTLAQLTRDPVLHRVGLGWLAVITLERLNAVVGLMVGLATLVYLCLRIRREYLNRHRPPSGE